MKSSTSFQKRSGKNYFEEFSNFDLFFQLVYMSATSAAGISRSRTFLLARELACPPARFFKTIHQVAENLRYNYPDAVRLAKALKARGVIPDYRPPNVVRLAPIPLYSTFADIWDTVQTLREIVDQGEHQQFSPERETVA